MDIKGIKVTENGVELTNVSFLLSPEYELREGNHLNRGGEKVLRIYSKNGSYVGTFYPGQRG